MEHGKQKILDQVMKLLALSEGTNAKHEADAAKAKAADLMAKHDINIMEAEVKPEFTTSKEQLKRKSPKKYERLLVNVISDFNGVSYIVQTGGGPAVNIFVGSDVNLESNKYMIDIINQQRTQAWKKYLADCKALHGSAPSKSARNKWFLGFSIGLSSKLHELTSIKENKIKEYGLVPVSKADAALAHYKKGSDVMDSKSRPSTYNRDGFNSGKDSHLNRGVGNSPTEVLQLG